MTSRKIITAKMDLGKDWEAELTDDISWIIERINSYEIGVALDGVFVDKLTSKQIHENHLKCLLRRDYLESKGQKKGLDQLILATLVGMKRMVLDPKNQCHIEEMNVLDSHL
jgi:hypothetical protein